ncbi:MAG: hypothetical protein K6T26_00080 [Alicyclobacillus sp.]|nr:hypothetical protein [Alicyclobacillus sp.]
MRVRGSDGSRTEQLYNLLYGPGPEAEQLLGYEEEAEWPDDWAYAPRDWTAKLQKMRRH